MKVASVQASPVFPMNREATVDKACSLIREAGRNGARLVVLPETFVPMYPNWSIDLSNPTEWAHNLLMLTRNAVEVPGPQVTKLCDAARAAQTCVCIGVNEYVSRFEGMLFNSLLFIDADGTLLGVHRKLTPSNRERCFWARGDGMSLRVYDTTAGRIGGLICYEHLQPLSKYMLMSQGEQIHCTCWPGWPNFANGRSNKGVFDVATRSYAIDGQCFVVASSMYVDPADGERAGLGNASWTFFGGSMIIGPEGDYIAGPVYDEEAILYGELDFDRIVLRKAAADLTGKDNRWDIMRVENNARPYVPFSGSFGERLASEMGLQESPAARRGTPPDALARRLDAIDSELRQLREELGRDPGDTFAP
ncbi:MAG: carbon-nitrogen hydrolase family protein [Dehalococcoidia bacterium]|nr:MAG: carbon-nitrogen hydrolase family protein [Dehalococcoidia bacterium]